MAQTTRPGQSESSTLLRKSAREPPPGLKRSICRTLWLNKIYQRYSHVLLQGSISAKCCEMAHLGDVKATQLQYGLNGSAKTYLRELCVRPRKQCKRTSDGIRSIPLVSLAKEGSLRIRPTSQAWQPRL